MNPNPEIAKEHLHIADAQYRQPNPNLLFNKGLHRLMSWTFKPEVSWAEGAEQAVKEHFVDGGKVMILMSHISTYDPFNAAAVIYNERALNPIIGNVVMPAKSPHFNNPILGPIMRASGVTIPVIRPQDSRKGLDKNNKEFSIVALQSNKKTMFENMIYRIDNGSNAAMFPEGTRNSTDNRGEVQPLKVGLLKVVKHLEKPNELMYVLMGFSYDEYNIGLSKRKPVEPHSPTINIAQIDPSQTSKLKLEPLRRALQNCVDSASEERQSRSPPKYRDRDPMEEYRGL